MSNAPTDLALDPATVLENAADGTVVGTLTVQDPDAGDTHHFTLLNDAGGRFALDPVTGVLGVADGFLLDYELLPLHGITVRVTDSSGLSYEKDLFVALADLYEWNWTGTVDPDSFIAPANDPWRVQGLKGADALTTGGGNDILGGGAGNDTLAAGAGDDVITFFGTAAGFDQVDGGSGTDGIRAVFANTAIGLRSFTGVEQITAGGLDNVWIQGSAGNNLFDFAGVTLVGIVAVRGGAGADTIFGSAAGDVIEGQQGNDLLRGDLGDDLFLVNAGGGVDHVFGGAGSDTVRAQADGVVITLAELSGVEHVDAGGFAGVAISGTDRADVLSFAGVSLDGIVAIRGGDGADSLTGSGGNDTLETRDATRCTAARVTTCSRSGRAPTRTCSMAIPGPTRSSRQRRTR